MVGSICYPLQNLLNNSKHLKLVLLDKFGHLHMLYIQQNLSDLWMNIGWIHKQCMWLLCLFLRYNSIPQVK